MKNILILTLQRFRRSKITSLFFIIGYMISMLLISVNTSFIFQHLNAASLKEKYTPPYGTQYVISTDSFESATTSEIISLLKGIRPDTGVIFNALETHPDNATVNTYCPVSAEYFTGDVTWHYPLSDGRYYTADELKKGEKVALIGKNLKGYTEKKKGKEIIHLYGDTYEVIGTVGEPGSVSLWDNRIFLPYSALPPDTKETFTWGSINFILYNKDNHLKKDINIIKKNGQQWKEFKLEKLGKIEVENMLNELMQNMDTLYIMAILGYLATLIYAVNILVYWLQRMRYEIGLRKACGYTNAIIFKRLYQEILGMCLVACCLALGIQILAGLFIDQTGIQYFDLSVWNVIISLIITFVSTLIILIIPFRRLAAINPVEILREE